LHRARTEERSALEGGQRKLHGALVFHNTTSSHLDASHITTVSFPDLPHFQQ